MLRKTLWQAAIQASESSANKSEARLENGRVGQISTNKGLDWKERQKLQARGKRTLAVKNDLSGLSIESETCVAAAHGGVLRRREPHRRQPLQSSCHRLTVTMYVVTKFWYEIGYITMRPTSIAALQSYISSTLKILPYQCRQGSIRQMQTATPLFHIHGRKYAVIPQYPKENESMQY